MREGGEEYTQEAAQAVRVISGVAAPVLVIYAILVMSGIVPSTHYTNVTAAFVISFAWISISAYSYLRPARTRAEQGVRLTLINLCALLMSLFVIGFAQPFAVLFVLLFITSYLFFGRIGFLVNVAAFLAAIVLDILIHFDAQPNVLTDDIFTAIALVFLGVSTVTIMSAQETKRQALIHSQRRERLQYDRILTIMNNLTDAAFTTDEKGSILMYNAASLDLLDTNDSLKNRNIGELFKLSGKDNAPVNLLDVLKETTRATRRDDLNHTYGDGESIRLEINLAPIRSNYSLSKKRDELGGFILIMRDVTKQKSLEEERDEFISVVSHELRTPITIVEGTLSNLDVLLHQPKQPDQKLLGSSIETAHDQVMYLARMVNDLSTLSRAERGVADAPEAIDVREMLHTLHQRYEKEAAAKKLHLNLDLGTQLGTANASRLYLEELLQNFITNAIKYTKEGEVTIQAKRSKNMVRFSVKDTGIGISRTDQTKVFNKFYRSEDYRIRETSGTGLGLYVAAKLAHKLHTHVELKSRLNHGSVFSFELPVE